jgi:hypothetical protein
MTWNHRIYNVKNQNLGEDYFVVKEVYYNDKNEPIGATDLRVGSETLEGLKWIAEQIIKSTEKPIIEDTVSKSDLDRLIDELVAHLSSTFVRGDISDLGNEIGIILGKYTSDEIGYELDSFIHGIKHGVSLTKGTH